MIIKLAESRKPGPWDPIWASGFGFREALSVWFLVGNGRRGYWDYYRRP